MERLVLFPRPLVIGATGSRAFRVLDLGFRVHSAGNLGRFWVFEGLVIRGVTLNPKPEIVGVGVLATP